MKISIRKLKLQIKNYKYEIGILFFSIIVSFCFFFSHGNISTDTGREAMIPLAILNGEVLYRDILNIYAPCAYFINALILKFFGIRLESLYWAGIFSSIIFLYSVFKISEMFVGKKISFMATLFVSMSCIYNTRLFNFIFPYSYSVTYGLTFYAVALLMLLNFCEKGNNKLLFLSALFAGASFACKIEFLPISAVVLFACIKYFKFAFGQIFKTIISLLIIPVLSYLIPFLQGMTFVQSVKAIQIFKKSALVPSVVDFAQSTGTAFSTSDFNVWMYGILFFSLYSLICYLFALKFKHNIVVGILLAGIFHYILKGETHFAFLPIAACVFFIFKFKYLSCDKKLFILAISAIGASTRTFFNLNTNEYGAYTFPLLFIFLLAILKKYSYSFKLKVEANIFLTVFLCAGIISNIFYSYLQLKMYSFPIVTKYGKISAMKEWKTDADLILQYIDKNIQQNDKILFLPEGSLFNFLSGRKTNMMIYALNAPYIETFGEENIIKMINSDDEIKYIAIIDGFGLYNFNKPRYYFSKNKITEYIKENYFLIFEHKGNGTETLILEKKKEG